MSMPSKNLCRMIPAPVLALLLCSSTLLAQAEPSPSPASAATLEQRVAGLEAYLTNGDPTVPLKTARDTQGNALCPPV